MKCLLEGKFIHSCGALLSIHLNPVWQYKHNQSSLNLQDVKRSWQRSANDFRGVLVAQLRWWWIMVNQTVNTHTHRYNTNSNSAQRFCSLIFFTHVPCAVSTLRPELWLHVCRVCPLPNTDNTQASYTAHSTCLDSPIRAPCMWRFYVDSFGDLSAPAQGEPGDAWRGDPGEDGTVDGTGRSRRRRTARTSRWPLLDSSRRADIWVRPLCSAGTCPQHPPTPGSWGIHGAPGRPRWDCGDTAGKWCRSCGESEVRSRAVGGDAVAGEAGGQSGGKHAPRLAIFGKGWSERWRSPHKSHNHCPPRCTNSFYPNPDNHNRRHRIRRLGCSVEIQHRGFAQEYSEHKPGKCCGSTAVWWAPGRKSRKQGILTLPPFHPWLL